MLYVLIYLLCSVADLEHVLLQMWFLVIFFVKESRNLLAQGAEK